MGRNIRTGIIGNGRMAKKCADIINKAEGIELSRSIVDTSRATISPDFSEYLTSLGCDFHSSSSINSQDEIDYLVAGGCDVVFSINNHQILRPALLESFPRQIINFHNGPLPRYAGLNAPSWALFNAEHQHGVTWHYVDEGIDTGDILAQKIFDIPEGTTARQLVMMSIDHGISLFVDLLAALEARSLRPEPQDLANRTFYSSSEIPGGARIDLKSSFAQVDRIVRALNFTPLESPFPYPALSFGGRVFFVDAVSPAEQEPGLPPGRIVRADTKLIVQGESFAIELTEVRNDRGERVPVSSVVSEYGIVAGMQINGVDHGD